MDKKIPGNGHKAWVFLQQRFQCDEIVTVLSVTQRLAGLQQNEDAALHGDFIHAQEWSTRLEQAGEHLSEYLLNEMVLNGLPERYEHIVGQASFNTVGSSVEFRRRLLRYEENCKYRESVDDVESHVAITSKKVRRQHRSSNKHIGARKSSSGQQTCFCCGMKGHN